MFFSLCYRQLILIKMEQKHYYIQTENGIKSFCINNPNHLNKYLCSSCGKNEYMTNFGYCENCTLSLKKDLKLNTFEITFIFNNNNNILLKETQKISALTEEIAIKRFNELYLKWIETNDKWIKPSLDHIKAKATGGDLMIDNLQFISWLENRTKIDIEQEKWKEIKKNISYYL